MNITVKDAGEVRALLDGMKKGAPKAAALWVNWLGIEARAEMRQQVPNRFSFRGTAAAFKEAIDYLPAANRDGKKRQGVLQVGQEGGKATRKAAFGAMLARQEEGSTRAANTSGLGGLVRTSGNKLTNVGFFIPARGLRTATTNPPRNMYPSAIGATMRQGKDGRLVFSSTTKGSKKQGTKASFFATTKGIFRRNHSGSGRDNLELIWFFRLTITTPARLGLWDTARKVFDRRALALGQQAVEEQMFRNTLK